MRELFKTLMPEIEAIEDKEDALTKIKGSIWPLSNRPTWYYQHGLTENGKDFKKTMEINHYIKFYLQNLINNGRR